jgi:hypothetical protein
MKVRKRAESSTPAIPMTRFLGNFETMYADLRHGVQRIGDHDDDGVGRHRHACSVAALMTS